MKSKDLTHLLSDEAKVRQPSPIKTTMKYFSDPEIVFLGAGMPPADMFPLQSVSFQCKSVNDDDADGLLEGTIRREMEDLEIKNDVPLSRALQYGNSRGQPELVGFLKEHTRIFHKLRYDDWGLITTAGSTQAWDACLRIFCNRGDTVLLEEYTYSSSLEAASAQGLNCVAVEMDADGILTTTLREKLARWDSKSNGPFPKLLYTIPNGQNPTGCTLHDGRKPDLMAIANEFDLIVIEDDPYYFLQMNGFGKADTVCPNGPEDELTRLSRAFVDKLSKSLLEFDQEGRVIRLESVSKTFAPGCRLGWAIGSNALLDQLWNFHEVSMQSTCGFAQAVINGMLQRWGQTGYMKWLLKLRNNYSMKRDHCLNQCLKHLPKDICTVNLPSSGMFFMVYLNAKRHPKFDTEFKSNADLLEKHLYQKLVAQGVLLACSSWFRVDQTKIDTLAFRGTYASVDPAKMENGIKLLAEVIRREFTGGL